MNGRLVWALVLTAVLMMSCGGDKSSSEVVPSTAATTTTTPIVALSATELQALVVKGVAGTFAESKAKIDSVLRGDAVTEAVRDISYNEPTNTVNIDLASSYPGGESYRVRYEEQAWAIGRGLAAYFWADEVVSAIKGRGGTVAMLPTLHIALDDLVWVCAPAVENAVSTKHVSKPGWLAKCRA